MNKFLRRGVSAVLAAGVVGAAIWAPLSTAQNEETYKSLKLFGDVFDTVRANYVEEVDDEALIRAAIQGMLQSLDPHSGYEPPEAYEETRSDVRGTFGGIGIQVTMEEGYVKVIAPIDDTPGARAGLQAEDLITALDGESVQGKTLDQAVEIMRGELGTDITLTVYRPATQKSFDVTVTRGNIPFFSVRTIIDDGDIGYIRINRFLGSTGESLEKELAKLDEEAAEADVELIGYILDLRNNPGGNLSQSIRVADAFLDDGEIVSVRNRNSEDDASYFAKKGDFINGKPLVVKRALSARAGRLSAAEPRLVVSGLAEGLTEEDVTTIFAEFGCAATRPLSLSPSPAPPLRAPLLRHARSSARGRLRHEAGGGTITRGLSCCELALLVANQARASLMICVGGGVPSHSQDNQAAGSGGGLRRRR